MPTQLATDYPKTAHHNVAALAARGWDNLPKYLASPLNGPSVESYSTASLWLRDHFDAGVSLVLDSGCGTGASTCNLARRYPDAAVIGVDRSAARLGKGERALEVPSNALLVQAELATFWRLMLEAESTSDGGADDAAATGDVAAAASPLSASRVSRHFVLYPNPYPKPSRLNLRWHGHPALPCLLGIGETVEVRSNWQTYLDEFREAATILTTRAAAAAAAEGEEIAVWEHAAAALSPRQATALRVARRRMGERHARCSVARVEAVSVASAADAITPFEAKFHANGEGLWRYVL